jgi:pyrrolidone-carboxylate peptidase
MRLLVTGFGPFGDSDDNPSAHLAQGCGHPHVVLEVAFVAVEEFLVEAKSREWDAWLMLGLASKSPTFRMEAVAHNWIGRTVDVRKEQWGPGPIDPKAPAQIHATLWAPIAQTLETQEVSTTAHAGDYLCNYLLFRGLQEFPRRRVGFLHVPDPATAPLERQQLILNEVIEAITGPQSETALSQW